MNPTKKQLYQRIADLEAQVAELMKQNAKLIEQVAALSKNSSNSSKPPSSDIVKPPKPKNPKGPRRQGGQTGHEGVTRPPFRPDQIDHAEDHHSTSCPLGHTVESEPTGEPKIQHTAELRDNPIIITEHRVWGHLCPICNKVIWGGLPEGVIEGHLGLVWKR